MPLRLPLAAVAVALVAIGLTGCSGGEKLVTEPPSDAFCDSVVKLEERLIRTPRITEEEWVTFFEPVAANAPGPVREDAEFFLDGLRRVQTDPDVKRDEGRYRKASERVQRYATEGCGLHESDSVF